MPKYSIIIPNYNHASFLNKRIESVLNQTYKDFEVIILDDKSTDNSIEIINSYRNNNHITHIILNSENSGSTFNQWEKGFKLCKGDYIWIAESDDVADLNFLYEFDSFLSKYENISLAFCLSNIINEKDEIIHVQDTLFKKNVIIEGHEFLKKYMLRKNPIINASSVIINRTFLPTSWNYKEFKYCGDWYFYSLIANRGNILVLNKNLNYFRMHNNKVTPGSMLTGRGYTEGIIVVNNILNLCKYHSIKAFYKKAQFISDLYLDIYVQKQSKDICIREIRKKWSPLIIFAGKYISKLRKIKKYFK